MQSFLLVSWSRAMLHTLSVTAPTSKKAKTTKWFGTWGHLGDSSKEASRAFALLVRYSQRQEKLLSQCYGDRIDGKPYLTNW